MFGVTHALLIAPLPEQAADLELEPSTISIGAADTGEISPTFRRSPQRVIALPHQSRTMIKIYPAFRPLRLDFGAMRL
jgi:hypothetical protein